MVELWRELFPMPGTGRHFLDNEARWPKSERSSRRYSVSVFGEHVAARAELPNLG